MDLGPVEPLDAQELEEFSRRWNEAAANATRHVVQLPGVSFEMVGARLTAALGPCLHLTALAVRDLLGEKVAALCPVCDTQLPAEWRTTD